MNFLMLVVGALLTITPHGLSNEKPEDYKFQTERVARALIKNYSVHVLFNQSNGEIEWLHEPLPAQMDFFLPLVKNELKSGPKKLRPVTKGIFLVGPAGRMQIYKGYDGTLTIKGIKVDYDELKRAMFRLQHERERRTKLKAEQAGAGQPATEPADKVPAKVQIPTQPPKNAPR